MPVNKPHLEFHRLDMNAGWETPPGYPTGIEQKILAGALDETGRSGSRTRLLRFAPGVFTTAPFVHDYWEEVYLISGDLSVGNDAEGRGGESFPAGTLPAVRRGPRTARSNRKPAACSMRSTITTIDRQENVTSTLRTVMMDATSVGNLYYLLTHYC
jgi:hypothetical protein